MKKLSTYNAHVIRDGIIEAKIDLQTGGGCHDNEPSQLAAAGMMFGSVLAYNPLEERAYLHVIEHARQHGELSASAHPLIMPKLAT